MHGKMRKSMAIAFSLATVLLTIFSQMPPSNAATDTPRLDEIWIKYVATGSIDALKAGDIDIIAPDTMGGWTEIQGALNAGFKSVSEISEKFAFVVINSRDYNPKTNASLWPLNDTAFRQALAWCFGTESKEDAIATVYGGPTNAPLDSMVSPAFMGYYNPDVPIYHTSFEQANETLSNAGYHVSGGNLFGPKGKLPDTIEVLTYSNPEFITARYMSDKFINAWNSFFGTFLGVANVKLVSTPVPMFPTLLPRVWIDKDFQIAFTIFQPILGPSDLSDYCASWLSSVPWSNAAGVHDGYVDYLCALTKYSLNETERTQACKDLQTAVAANAWYIPIWVDYAMSLFDSNLVGYVRGIGVGFENAWTWRSLKWKDPTEKSVIRWTASPPDSDFNPAYESSMWDWGNERQLFEPLLETDPWYLLKLVPWVAQIWKVEQITTPSGNDGQKITFTIRDNIFWQDSGAYNDTNKNGQWDSGEPKYDYPVTAEDVAFAMSFIRTFYLPNYYPIYLDEGVYDQKVVDSKTVEIYVNSTNAWLIYNIANWALMFPKHIWQKVNWGNVQTFDPGATLYKDWTGLNPPDWTKTAQFDPAHGGMKALIGCGPFVFDFWSDSAGLGHHVRNPNYWCDWRREDVNLDLKVNIMDISTAALAFSTTPTSPRWSAPSDINDDNKIDIRDIAMIALAWAWVGIH